MSIVLAANNGDVGGGEVMLLQTAKALRDLDVDVHVVGPGAPDGVVARAEALGMPTTTMAAGRKRYLRELRRWAAGHDGWLWCHGLVPATATALRHRRVVHLHQVPAARHRPAARLARAGAAVTLVPSRSTASAVPGAQVLWNWSEPVETVPAARGGPLRVGFIGRHSTDKGLDVLARALRVPRQRPTGTAGGSCWPATTVSSPRGSGPG